MKLFKINGKFARVKEKPFKTEKEIQNLTEQNLGAIFNLQFISSEFSVGNFRLDTLTFDQETRSFVIIEYKKTKNFSLVDQGYAYLSVMLNNKADFILEYNETQSKPLKKSAVDWSQPRIIFVSPAFTNYQKESINFKNMPFELWHIRRFENDTVSFEQIGQHGSREMLPDVIPPDNTAKEVVVYTEESNLEKANDVIRELYFSFKDAIFSLGEFDIKPKKLWISFVLDAHTVCDIHIQQKALKLWINLKKDQLKDGIGLTEDVASKGHWGKGDYQLQVKDADKLEYIVSLIKQAIPPNQ